MALSNSTLKKEEAVRELWRRGNLKYKCHAIQKEMRDVFYASEEHSTLVWLLARQSGKSYLLAILALEQAIREPYSIIKIVTDTKTHAESIFTPIFRELLEDCPEEMKPDFTKQKFSFIFPNGSEIQLAGSDGKHYEKLRGQKASLCLVDEAGFCTDLEEIVKGVLIPTTTHTGGRVVMASTVPVEPDHEFFKFQEKAEADNKLTKKTLLDNPLLTVSQIDAIIDSMGGRDSPRFRREYLCVADRGGDSIIFPEFTPELEKKIVREWVKPAKFDSYESMDLGFKDYTVVLFAYFDFRNNKLVIEDEIVLRGNDVKLPDLIASIKQKEAELWTNPLTNEITTPCLRVSDINYIVTQEIARISKNELSFMPARKDDKEAAVNQVRVALVSEQIIIHPRCKVLLSHIRNCRRKFSVSGFGFNRSGDGSHYDAVDALIYLVRHANLKKNPYPPLHDMDKKDLYIRNSDVLKPNNGINQLARALGGLRKFKK